MRTTTLERYHRAQAGSAAGFAAAMTELRTTGKRGHWVWYIFPQLAGLGASSMAQKFALHGVEEAAEYVRDPVLRARLLAATRAVADRLDAGTRLEDVMGSHIDSLKVVSSLTLFEGVLRSLQGLDEFDAFTALADAAKRVLETAEAQGYARCAFTLRKLLAS